MRLTRLRLTNITCFEDVTLDFTSEETGEPADWVVILGENGTGKSTLLQMLGVAFLGEHQLAAIAGDVAWNRFVRQAREGIQEGFVHLDLPGLRKEAVQLSDKIEFWFSADTVVRPFKGWSIAISGDNAHLFDENFENLSGSFAAGYSSSRRLFRKSQVRGDALQTLNEGARPYRFATLFGDDTALTYFPDWLFGLDYRALRAGRTGPDQKRFEQAVTALETALPDVKFAEITPDREVIVEEAGTRVPLDRLSDGYRGTLAWVGDLIRRLFDAYPNSEDPLKERGVVLVDEIDLHLHPTWQRRIVADIRRLFPNLQFIVTTHSPFVAQDMTERDRLIVLRRQEQDNKTGGRSGPVVAEHANLDVRNWRVDQILTSYLFSLPGTRDDEIVKKEQRLQKLLDKEEARGGLSSKEQRERDALLRLLDGPGGPPVADQELFDAADAVIAALTGRELDEDGPAVNGSAAGD